MKRLLVTGGTGFIGSNLAGALLREGYSVRIFRRAGSNLANVNRLPVEHRIGDVRDFASLRAAMRGCDTVFHTAAIVSFWKPLRALQRETNVDGTRNVVEACLRENVATLVHTSSVAAIGHPSDGQLADENTNFDWERFGDGYKHSKYLAELEVKRGVEHGLRAVMVNPAVVIGAGDIRFNGGKIVRAVKNHQALFYIKGGMNIVYVDDVVRGHISAALRGKSGERYILGGENLTLREAFRRTAEAIGTVGPKIRVPVALVKAAATALDLVGRLTGIQPILTSELISGAGIFNWYSSAKAERELDYTITPFSEAIAKTYQWYIDNGLL